MSGETALGTGLALLMVVMVAGGAIAWWLRRVMVVVTVQGPSMEPTFSDGDQVLARRIRPHRVRRDQAVLVAPARLGPHGARTTGSDADPVTAARQRGERLWLVKRVAAVPGDPTPPHLAPALADAAGRPVPPGHLVILGDNPEHSVDSRHEGFVPAERIRAVVVRRLATPS